MQPDKNLINSLKSAGQDHLLKFFAELSEEDQQRYTGELAGLDLELLSKLIRECVLQKPVLALPDDLEPAPYFPLIPRNAKEADYYRQR